MKIARLIILASIVSLGTGGDARSTPDMDWDAVQEEVIALLSELIAIDTSNPPGNEIHLVRYLKAYLARDGIDSTIYESAPGRASLVARYPGTGQAAPTLIMAHIDVVGVEEGAWESDPFTATIKEDGYLYGRGAIDDKAMAAALTVILGQLKRQGFTPTRDIIFLAGADEESGSAYGISWLLEHHPDAIAAPLVLNEGGKIIMDEGGQLLYVGVQNTEKLSTNVRLVARGVSGHGSVPRPDNPLLTLGRALARLDAYEPPVALNDTTRRFFTGLGQSLPAPEGDCYLNVAEDPTAHPDCLETVRKNLVYRSMLADSIAPTIIKGGIRSNVIPSEAELTLNCRLLPGTDPDAFLDRLRRVIDEPAVTVEWAKAPTPAPRPSSTETPLFRAIERAAAKLAPGVPVVPYMSTGATDSARMRARDSDAYGLLPFPLTEEDLSRMHGNNERVPLTSLAFGTRLLYEILRDVAQARD